MFRRLTREQLQTLAQHHVSYNRAMVLADRFDALFDPGVRALLADEEIHLFGFEIIANGDVPDPPFPGITGGIGIMVFWLTPELGSPADDPYIYAVALQGAEGAIELAPAVGTGPTDGGIFVSHFDGDADAITPENWCERLSTTTVDTGDPTDGPVDGERVVFEVADQPFLWSLDDIWYQFGGRLTLQGGPDELTVRYRNVRYRHLEWFLGLLGLKSVPAGGASPPPEHRFFNLFLKRAPMWAPDIGTGVEGEFMIEGRAATTTAPAVPARYGNNPLWFGITGRQDDVKQLQSDLWGLGFWFPEMVVPGQRATYNHAPGQQRPLLTAHATGTFDAQTEWAVREFQIYAGMERVARHTGDGANRYGANLLGTENTDRYTGPVTGVLDGATAQALEHWRTNDYRCPVVVESRNGASFGNVVSQNLWVRNAETNTGTRMFTYDVSRYYPIPGGHRQFQDAQGDGSVVTGDYQPSGPRSVYPRHVVPEGELVPEQLIGVPHTQLNADAAMRATYKVVRALAEQECMGYADSVNSWDNQIVSLGPCHWTYRLGALAGNAQPVTEGELPAFLSYMKREDEPAFDRAVGRFGVDVATAWGNDGNALSSGLRTYTGRLRLRYRTGDATNPTRTEFSTVLGRDRDYFRNWHWFHRFVMAGRFLDNYRQRMWHMARLRVRDIREAEIGVPVPHVGGAGGRTARIGDVFSSELATGMLLRWHTYRPAHIITGGNAGGAVDDAFAIASARAPGGINLNQDPATWPANNAYGALLANGILERVPNNTFNTAVMNARQVRGGAGTLFESNPGLPIQNRGAVLDEGGVRREWRGAGAVHAFGNANHKRGLLLSLDRVINWPAGANMSATNHPGPQSLYQTLGGLRSTHGSFELDYDDLPRGHPYPNPVFDPR